MKTNLSLTEKEKNADSKVNSEAVCLDLMYAESEAQVQEIISKIKEMKNPQNWKPLDGRETNFNVTSNQASDGGKALTELMTNMVDAVLLKHAYENEIDPKGKKAPKTMYEAVDRLIKNLKGGKLTHLDAKDAWLKSFAEKNLVIGVTGAKKKKEGLPCYTFVDNGEGQAPENFENTFLSLSAGNKKSIPFVQGKFNMGSSGVLRYCGRQWYKLIVSRRYDGKSPWGWTLVRRRPDNEDNMPIAEYFVLPNGEIPSFKTDRLFPFKTMTEKTYEGVNLATGTIIKLYDYQVGSKFMTFRGSREALNENLVETILPFRILDFRQLPSGTKALEAAKKKGADRAEGVDPRPFYGMEFLLLRSNKEAGLEDEEEDAAGEKVISVENIEDPALGKISISAIPLKREIPGWLKGSNNRVFHAVNGQVQFKQTRGFVSYCGFPALKDRIVVIVDASNLTFKAHNDIWKGDREHLSNTVEGERYKELVEAALKGSPALKELQSKIAQQELDSVKESESNALFQQIVDKDRNIAFLLSDKDPKIRLPSAGGGDGGAEKGSGEFKDGKYSPTFVKFESDFSAKSFDMPIDRSKPIAARTDAENGYLNRADNQGKIILDTKVREHFTVREQLHNGRLVIFLQPLTGKVSVGDKFKLKLSLKDDAMADAVSTQEITIHMVEPPPPPDPKDKDKKEPSKSGDGSNEPGKGKDAPTHGLPVCKLLTNDGRPIKGYDVEKWPEGFNENEGGLMEDIGDGQIVYKINYDNAYHIKYKEQARGQLAKEVVTAKFILGMRFLMLGFEGAYRAAKTASGSDGDVAKLAEFDDVMRRIFARGAASTVIALAETLPNIVDATSVKPEDE